MEMPHDAPGYVAPWNLEPAAKQRGASTKIGVLALQGAFREHVLHLQKCDVEAVEVKQPADLADLHGLVIPGGESTAMALIAKRQGILPALQDWVAARRPTWGTCAGMIMLAKEIDGSTPGGQESLRAMDTVVSRNYFGSQLASFEAPLACTVLGEEACRAIFIRAPSFIRTKEGVEVLAVLRAEDHAQAEDVTVAARQGPFLACAFHPELTDDLRWHQYFVGIVRESCT